MLLSIERRRKIFKMPQQTVVSFFYNNMEYFGHVKGFENVKGVPYIQIACDDTLYKVMIDFVNLD